MAQHLTQWVTEHVNPIRTAPDEWLTGYHFHRDPDRTICVDPTIILAPADGTIIYQTRVEDPENEIINLHGRGYTLHDATGGTCTTGTGPHWVIGIFLTAYDIHVQRAPIGGRCVYKWLPPAETNNLSMIDVENCLVDGETDDLLEHVEYLYVNERVINTFTNALRKAYVLQIADLEVDVITPFYASSTRVEQGDRFSAIRFGSQVDLIVPDDGTLEPMLEVGWHVEAGLDGLLKAGGQ